MTSRRDRAREIQRRIGAILLRDWDPIGVAGIHEARSEYESYVGGVYRLLASGASARKIADHLVAIERRQMGLTDSSPKAVMPVARRLLALKVAAGAGGRDA